MGERVVTGWPAECFLLQDLDRGLSKWFAGRLGARWQMENRMNDDDSEGDFWRDVNVARQAKRADNRSSSAELLRKAGISFEVKNIDAHLIVKLPRATIDFWPGTGLWMVRGQPTRRYGVRGLIQFSRMKATGAAFASEGAAKP